jgi:hypothetical protein
MHPLLKRYFPGLFYLEKRRRGRHLQGLSTEQVFTRIYQNHGWLHPESKSGSGSTLKATAALSQALPKLLREFRVTSLLDLPCGDFNWLQHVDLPVERYLGADIVQDVIDDNVKCYANPSRAFVKLDLIRDDLPDADLLLCRDCLTHFNYDDIFKAVANLRRSKITYLLTTTYVHADYNLNIVTGQWRPLNFLLPPFAFPEPLALIDEKAPSGSSKIFGKSLGLWKIAELNPTTVS